MLELSQMFCKVLGLAAYVSSLVGAPLPSLQVPMAACDLDVHSVPSQPYSPVNSAISTTDWDPEKVTGRWYNQLGSIMELDSSEDGRIWGTYNSAVGDVKDFYWVNGHFDADPPTSVYGPGVSIGWTVTYQNSKRNNAHSTATWSGQFFDDAGGGDERILTQWLLTTSTPPGPKNTWDSTYLGHDTFTRKRPSAAEIAQARALNVDSPYLEDILKHSQVNNNEVAIVDVDWDRLNGVWYNELGSKMSLNIFDDLGGEFRGEYNSTVGKAVNSYDLSGWVDSDPPRGQGISIGWAVSYRNAQLNAHSTATWSGQFFDSDDAGGDHHDHGGKILTQWLLTTSTLPGPKNTWNSTHLGRDTFTRKKPDDAEIAQARAVTCMTDGSPRMEDILAML